jgi:acetylornithine deacetylase/succinyl-diaminopimelate desuccinylase-like protein
LKGSIVELASELVRIPSRAGIDPVEEILDFLSDWLAERHLHVDRLYGPTGAAVGLYLHLRAAGLDRRSVLMPVLIPRHSEMKRGGIILRLPA